jgi:TRAP-type uncharacterized transport system fused permease subunit
MADLTPPVALAVFAAAAISRAPPMRTGIEAVRVAIAGFVVPFMAVYDPALMLLTNDPLEIAYILLKALLSIALWGAAAIGYLFAPLTLWERAMAAAGAFLLVAALPVTDEAGFVLAVLTIGVHSFKVWRQARIAATEGRD